MILKPVKVKGLEIHWWTFLLFLVGFAFGFVRILAIAYIITAIHEFAHIISAKICDVKIDGVEILPFGITMRVSENYITNTADEIRIALAGPVSNFIIAYFAYGFYDGIYRDYIIVTSLAMGIFNLLPALPLDGGRVLRALMVKKFGFIRAANIAITITNILAIFIIASGLYVLYITGFNFSFLLIGGFLTANMTEERKNANTVIMKDILYSRKKLAEKGVAEADAVVADIEENANKILKKLSYDRYYLINIVDSRMRVVKTVTETQVIEAMAVYGMNLSMKKIVEL